MARDRSATGWDARTVRITGAAVDGALWSPSANMRAPVRVSNAASTDRVNVPWAGRRPGRATPQEPPIARGMRRTATTPAWSDGQRPEAVRSPGSSPITAACTPPTMPAAGSAPNP